MGRLQVARPSMVGKFLGNPSRGYHGMSVSVELHCSDKDLGIFGCWELFAYYLKIMLKSC